MNYTKEGSSAWSAEINYIKQYKPASLAFVLQDIPVPKSKQQEDGNFYYDWICKECLEAEKEEYEDEQTYPAINFIDMKCYCRDCGKVIPPAYK